MRNQGTQICFEIQFFVDLLDIRVLGNKVVEILHQPVALDAICDGNLLFKWLTQFVLNNALRSTVVDGGAFA